MSSQLGVNTIGSVERPSIIAGDFPRVTGEFTALEDISIGAILMRSQSTGQAYIMGSSVPTVPTTPTDFYPWGIAAEDVEMGNVGTAWLCGEFVKERVYDHTSGAFVSSNDMVLRQLGIYLKSARLAPNM